MRPETRASSMTTQGVDVTEPKATPLPAQWAPSQDPIPAHWMARVDRCHECNRRTFPSDARPVPGGFETVYVCDRDRSDWVTAWWGE